MADGLYKGQYEVLYFLIFLLTTKAQVNNYADDNTTLQAFDSTLGNMNLICLKT